MQNVLAVDLGGTKTSMAIVTGQGGLHDYRKLPATRSMDETIERITAASGSVSAVGIIVPGIYNASTGGVWCPNLFGRDEVPMLDPIQQRVGVQVVIDSDRAGYVLGESWLGAARGLRDVIFVAIGTGIGVGILAGGRVVRGAHGIAGAAGWWSLTPEWKDIYEQCGCWEAEAAGPAIARAGDAIRNAADYTGRAIANLISVFDPEMVVLGGGVMQGAFGRFIEPIREAVLKWGQPLSGRACRIEPSSLGEHAGLLGAARLAFERI